MTVFSEKRPLIMHVIHHLLMGGMENGLVNLINALPKNQFRHVIVCIENDSDFRERIVRKDVSIIVLHRSRIGVWALRKQLFVLCRRLQPALIHSRNLSGLDVLLPARLAGVRYCIHSEHGRDMDDLQGNNYKLLVLRALHRPLVNRYITVSKDLQHYLAAQVGVTKSRISQIYNGVDTERFHPTNNKPCDILPDAFMGANKLVVGTVGRLQAVKDQATLIRAFADLLNQSPEWVNRVYLAIVGAGPLFDELSKLVDTLGISKNVWLPGKTDNVADILKAFDIFVLPSLSEGISNTILEAMATGLPVLATAVGGNVELVKPGYNGQLFSAGDSSALRDLIAAYVTDDVLRKQHGMAARQVALTQFSLNAMVSAYQKVYEQGLALQV
ncbi:TIGR03088 family PEP-CTERM/XrtA system glycosyltransferase [Crenothrix polyspora]|uniref:Sugar transferase, PEP-CTERM/EpsH1 system associated n=1 Tax=Crenothrix polyspora TaxID=360316 RepID=A0A1R4H999_9GAMM|nr:TIGR03088 family PEP-CTERM/XrtA system glycosyltransferase [Crenothrix polyspora]SJM92832.1 Sugar transferase, PEP-CTERM/EpsH1 system associated [Crenothrix polyspora]